jgi:hypothetical protein
MDFRKVVRGEGDTAAETEAKYVVRRDACNQGSIDEREALTGK